MSLRPIPSPDGDKRFLYHIVGFKRRKAHAHERFHRGAIARNKLAPARVLRIVRYIAQERR